MKEASGLKNICYSQDPRTFVLPNHTCKEVYVHPMRERVFVKHSIIQMFFHAKFKNWKGEIDEDGTLVQKKKS